MPEPLDALSWALTSLYREERIRKADEALALGRAAGMSYSGTAEDFLRELGGLADGYSLSSVQRAALDRVAEAAGAGRRLVLDRPRRDYRLERAMLDNLERLSGRPRWSVAVDPAAPNGDASRAVLYERRAGKLYMLDELGFSGPSIMLRLAARARLQRGVSLPSLVVACLTVGAR